MRALRQRWLSWAQVIQEVFRREADDRRMLAFGVGVVGLSVAGQLPDGAGGRFMPDPWPGALAGIASSVLLTPPLARASRGRLGVHAAGLLGLAVIVGSQLPILLLANSAHGAFFWGLMLFYVSITSGTAARVRSGYAYPFPLIASGVCLATAWALAPDREHQIAYAVIGVFQAPASVSLGTQADNHDRSRARETALRAQNTALLLELKQRDLARLESLLEQLAGRAHDFGGPVLALEAALARAVSLLSAPTPHPSGWAVAADVVARAREHAERLRQMVGQAKEELRSVSMPPLERVDLDPLLVALARDMELRFPDVCVHVAGDQGAAPQVRGGAQGLARVLDNLASNGATAARVTDVRALWVTVRRGAETVDIVIEDSGRGFEDDSRAPQGTGVGLLSARRIVETSGWTIEIDRSAARGGARVTVSLPAT